MKYLVMECTPGYAVLMDENANVVRAANLHYTVGQTVTDPFLMQEPRRRISRTVIRIAAAAACLLMLSAAGFGIYDRNRRTSESVVVMVEQTRYQIALNRSGEVIQIEGTDPDGQKTVSDYGGQHLTLTAALNTVLQESVAQGSVGGEEPVQIYVSAGSDSAYNTCKSELEQEAAKLQIKAEVQALDPAGETPPPPAEAEAPPQPPGADQNPPEPPQPGETPKENVQTDPPQEAVEPPHAEPPEPPQPGIVTEPNGVQPPGPENPPVSPEEEPPEPPAPGEPPVSPESPEPPVTPPAAPPAPEKPPLPAAPQVLEVPTPEAVAPVPEEVPPVSPEPAELPLPGEPAE